MANTAALLAQLLTVKVSLANDIQMQVFYSNKLDANSAKLSVQTKAQNKWQKAFDNAMDSEKAITDHGFNYAKGQDRTEEMAEAYANAVAQQYDEELMNELEVLDIEYDTMNQFLQTVIEKERAEEQNLKEAVSNAAQDTGRLGS